MSPEHKELSAGRWFELSLVEQMANIGSEIERAITWKKKGNKEYTIRAFERALELLDLSVADQKNRLRLREILRVREVLVDFFFYENCYKSTDRLWQGYFLGFAFAARINT
jgi:hypothetical protein